MYIYLYVRVSHTLGLSILLRDSNRGGNVGLDGRRLSQMYFPRRTKFASRPSKHAQQRAGRARPIPFSLSLTYIHVSILCSSLVPSHLATPRMFACARAPGLPYLPLRTGWDGRYLVDCTLDNTLVYTRHGAAVILCRPTLSCVFGRHRVVGHDASRLLSALEKSGSHRHEQVRSTKYYIRLSVHDFARKHTRVGMHLSLLVASAAGRGPPSAI